MASTTQYAPLTSQAIGDTKRNLIVKSDDTAGAGTLELYGKSVAPQYEHSITYISGTGTAGTDNTAMTIKTVTLPANTLTQVNDRMRIRTYFAATGGAPAVGATKLNTVTTADTSVSSTNLALTECWIHYLDATHANIIENESGALGGVSAVNVAGFAWASNQDIIFTQNQVPAQHLVLYAMIIDIFPKGI